MELRMTFSLKVGPNFVSEEKLLTMKKDLPKFLNRNYLEGAIYIEWNGELLMGEEKHDYIDQLLCYILNDIDQILTGVPFVTYFPDQPLELELKPHNALLLVRIGEKQADIPLETFFQAFYGLCLRFFTLLKQIYPSANQSYSKYMHILSELPLRYPWILFD